MNAKEIASKIFFEHWFNNYDLLHSTALKDSLAEVDKLIEEESEPHMIDYWLEVRSKLLSFKG